MANDTAMRVHPVDEILPAQKLVPLGLQHVLVMYAGAVAVPLIIGRALDLGPAEIAFLINADLFACGIVTLIQAFGMPGVGIRLPVMMGVTFASVGPMLAMIASGKAAGLPKEQTLNLIYGSVIAAGIFGVGVSLLQLMHAAVLSTGGDGHDHSRHRHFADAIGVNWAGRHTGRYAALLW